MASLIPLDRVLIVSDVGAEFASVFLVSQYDGGFAGSPFSLSAKNDRRIAKIEIVSSFMENLPRAIR